MCFLPIPPPFRGQLLRLLLVLTVPLVFLPCSSAQQQSNTDGTIVGQLRVARNGFLPNNVLVVLQARGAQVSTKYADGEGKFYFEGLPGNVYHVLIQEKGFQPLDIGVNVNPLVQHIAYVYPELVPVEEQAKPRKTAGDVKGSNPAMVDPATLLSRFPKEAQKHYEKATELQQEGKQRAAMEEYRKALAIAPDMYFARNNLGSLYLQDQQFENAEAQFREVIEKNRADANAYFNLANVFLLTKRLDEATNFIQQGMTREPQSAFGHFLMGSVMLQKGTHDEAEKQLHAALEQDPAMANAHLALANLYLQQKRNTDVVEELQSFLQQAPDSSYAPHARELLKKLRSEGGRQ
jgi:tetratricopeptide (TPR) repeat protein